MAVTATNNGKTLAYQYDAASNRTRITWPDAGANALYVTYVYDILNRVTQIEENGATSGPGVLAAYTYDSLGRRSTVTRANGGCASTGYAYDANNNLLKVAQSGVSGTDTARVRTFAYDSLSRLLCSSAWS